MSNKKLGTPYKRGKSDVIDSWTPYGNVAIDEGKAVTLQADGTIKTVTSTSDIVIGVAGVQEPSKKQSVVRSGMEVYVQLDTAAAPAVGKAVYVTASGKFTDSAKAGEADNIAVNAIFTSSIVKAENSKCVACDAAAIDFGGGL